MTELEILDRCILLINSNWSTADLKALAEKVAREILESNHRVQKELKET